MYLVSYIIGKPHQSGIESSQPVINAKSIQAMLYAGVYFVIVMAECTYNLFIYCICLCKINKLV